VTQVERILTSSRTVVVLGARDKRHKAGFYVGEYLFERGYHVIGVNPRLAGRSLWSGPVRATLDEIAEPVDLLDVFRRPEDLPGHLDAMIALRPKVVWFQLGIRHDAVAGALEAAGIEVVQDRCTLADHQMLGL